LEFEVGALNADDPTHFRWSPIANGLYHFKPNQTSRGKL